MYYGLLLGCIYVMDILQASVVTGYIIHLEAEVQPEASN